MPFYGMTAEERDVSFAELGSADESGVGAEKRRPLPSGKDRRFFSLWSETYSLPTALSAPSRISSILSAAPGAIFLAKSATPSSTLSLMSSACSLLSAYSILSLFCSKSSLPLLTASSIPMSNPLLRCVLPTDQADSTHSACRMRYSEPLDAGCDAACRRRRER